MQNAGLDEAQAGIKFAGRNINDLRYADNTSLSWMKHKLESSLLGEISMTSDMQITPPLWQKVKRN